jgi:hypothetical protein
VFGLLIVSVSVNVLQANRLRSSAEARVSIVAHVGRPVAPFAVIDAQRRAVTIQFDRGVPTVLYYFRPACLWCERSWDNVRAIAAHADGRYRVVALASETELGDFRRDHDLPFEVYGGLPARTRNALGFTSTPRTVVVSPQGLISHEWAGVYTGSLERAVEDFFEISLPGLAPQKPINTALQR